MIMASFLLLISGIFLVVSLSIPLVREKSLTSEPSGHEDYSDGEGDDDSKSVTRSQKYSTFKESYKRNDMKQFANSSQDKIVTYLKDFIRKNTKNLFDGKRSRGTGKGNANYTGSLNENGDHHQTFKTLEQNLDNFVAVFNTESIAEPTPELISVGQKGVTQALVTMKDFHDMISCIYVKGFQNDRWIQVVSRCPPEWTNQTVQRLCQEEAVQNGPVLELPVQNDQGITFANHFCAACHGVSKLLEWKVGWTCDDTRVFAASVGGYFSSGAVSEGFFLGLQQDQSCKMTVTPPIANTIESCSPPHFRHGPSIPINNYPGTNYPVSFNVLMNFDFAGKTHILFVAEYEEETEAGPRCERDEAYDPFQNECRQVFCAPGQRLSTTGCVPEQNVHASSPVHRETQGDLSQLADSRDIQRVHMEVNIPASDLLLFNISGYNDYLQEQIAAQLNISRYRIKNFEVSFHQGNSSSNSVVIQTMSKEECREEALECDDNEGSSNPTRDDLRTTSSASPTVSGSMTRPDSVTMPTNDDKDGRGSGSYLTDTSSNPQGVMATFPENAVTDSSRDYVITATSAEDVVTTASVDYVVRISFILQPSRKGEQRSLDVVESLSSLVSKQRLRLMINGTSLLVVSVDNNESSDTVEPACPYGRTSVQSGDMMVLQRYNPGLGNTETLLYVNNTGIMYPTGKFELTVGIEGSSLSMNYSEAIRVAVVCDMPHIAASQCLRIQLERSEYEWDPRGKELRFQNQSYNFSSFEVVNESTGSVEICVPDTYAKSVAPEKSRRLSSCYVNYENLLKAEGYMTAVMGRVSIVALASVLITYCLFPKLRNLPGVNIVNLTTALFIAEIIFITGEDIQTRWLCSAIAAALHYFFLASHCWMNVMSYDVFRTFTSSACILTRIRDKGKYLPRYALYAWGAPLLVIGACVFIDFSHVLPGINIGYGGTWAVAHTHDPWPHPTNASLATTTDMAAAIDHHFGGCHDESRQRRAWERDVMDSKGNGKEREDHEGGRPPNETDFRDDNAFKMPDRSCWIQQPLAALFAFGAPILIIFLVNCFLFARTILSIRRTAQLAKLSTRRSSVRNLSGRSDVILYVKMATVMGFTWVFGLASSIISAVVDEPTSEVCMVLHVLGILFPIMNCSQGLFIFFVYVFNRRVLRLYKEKAVEVRKMLLAKKQNVKSAKPSRSKNNIAYIYKE